MSVLTTSDVQKRAQKALRASPFYALRELMVELDDEALVISGLVSSFYHKQLDAAEGVEVVNAIDVR
jgi:hypothetical protein